MHTLAADRRVILFDSASLGECHGEVPSPLSGAARVAAGLIESLRASPADMFGCSMGGMTAQILAIEHTELKRPTAIIDVIRANV